MVSETEDIEDESEESSEDEPEEPEETGPNAKEKTAMGRFHSVGNRPKFKNQVFAIFYFPEILQALGSF